MDYWRFIEIVPDKRSGHPCIKGTRITVSDVLNWISCGMSKKEILHDFPELNLKQIEACIAFDADPKNHS